MRDFGNPETYALLSRLSAQLNELAQSMSAIQKDRQIPAVFTMTTLQSADIWTVLTIIAPPWMRLSQRSISRACVLF